nr:MAG TPA: hypothetical protein [Caudoviricetes sp.]
MLNPLEDKGMEHWLSMPKQTRNRFVFKRIRPEARSWVRVIAYLAWTGDERAQAIVRRLFVCKRGKFLARGGISVRVLRHITSPILRDSFIGVNGRKF